MPENNKPPWARLYATALLWFVVLLFVFVLPLPLGWQQLIAWGILVAFLGNLARWLHIHRAALAREARETRVHKGTSPQRDVPLGPVQANYLRVMERYTRKNE
jgi:uncharacterized protein (DUF58 family)